MVRHEKKTDLGWSARPRAVALVLAGAVPPSEAIVKSPENIFFEAGRQNAETASLSAKSNHRPAEISRRDCRFLAPNLEILGGPPIAPKGIDHAANRLGGSHGHN